MPNTSFEVAVKDYLSDRTELRNSVPLLVVALEHVATTLDENVTSGLITEYRKLLSLLDAAAQPSTKTEDGDDLLTPNR